MLRVSLPVVRGYSSLVKTIAVLLSLAIGSYVALDSARLFGKSDGAPSLPSMRLGEYRLALPPIAVAGIKHNLSGLTFNPDTKTLFGVLNAPAVIVEFTREGEFLRYIELNGFDDTEAISYLGEGLFAIAEERRRMISLVQVDESTDLVRYADVAHFLIDPEVSKNKGLEGLTYDPQSQMLFVVKERSPRRIYLVPLPSLVAGAPRVFRAWDPGAIGLRDLSGVQFQPGTGTLLIVSDESKEVVETTLSGEVISKLRLRSGHGGLPSEIEQAEGIAVDDQGTLFIVSEPNMLYVYAKRD
jgi:uncharacterized protein YjiK